MIFIEYEKFNPIKKRFFKKKERFFRFLSFLIIKSTKSKSFFSKILT